MSYSPYPNQGAYSPSWQGQPPQKKSNKAIWIILTIVGVVVAIGVIGCIGVVFFFFSVTRDSTSYKDVRSPDGLTTLSVPKNWQTGIIPNPEATIRVCNPFSENYALVISEPKSEMPGISLVQYHEFVVDNLLSNCANGRLIPEGPGEIGGMNAASFKMYGTVDGIPVVYYGAVVESRSHMHQVLTWTLQNREANNSPILEKVRNSFQVKNR